MSSRSTAVAVREPEQQQHPLVVALDERTDALAEMLPGGSDAAARFKRVVIQAVVRNPDLMKCTPNSIVAAVMESATIGIEPTGTLGGAYLVPYGNKATLIVGYRGLIELARRSGEIESIEARVVREGDEFSYEYGTDAHVRHIPLLDAGKRELTFVYAVAKLRGGAVQFEVMTREQVDAIRGRSKSGNSGPWKTDYEEMARKTVVRRLVKYLPIAVEARDLIAHDDEGDFEPGAVVSRVSAPSTRTDQARSRAAALRPAPPVKDQPDEPEAEPESMVDVDDIPFEQAAGASTDVEDVVPAARCSHPQDQRTADERGVSCAACGVLLAGYGSEADGEATPRNSSGTPRRKGLRQRLMEKLHAAYGLEHDQARDIAMAHLDKPDDFSLAEATDEELSQLIAFLDGLSDEEATKRVHAHAVSHGLVKPRSADPWSVIDPLAEQTIGKPTDELTPAQWVAFGQRIAAGDFDPVPA